jgi:uncharacterized protein
VTDFDPFNDDDLEALERFMLLESGVDTAMDISTLDGFLTAIVCGPETIAPSEWFELIWGEDGQPEWHSEAQFGDCFMKVISMLNVTAITLMEQPMLLEPLFLEHEADGKSWLIVDNWCDGFLQGVALRASAWALMPGDDLAPMQMFASEDGWQQLDAMSDEEVEFWQGQIAPAVRRIHAYWLALRSDDLLDDEYASTPVVRAGNKIGRNDPCPCGSGRKYKRCCGAH